MQIIGIGGCKISSIQKAAVKVEERTDLLSYRSSVARVVFDGLILWVCFAFLQSHASFVFRFL